MSEPTKQRAGDQVLPNGIGACVQDRIIAEMEDSKAVGMVRYGQTLRTFNGRRSIQDVREEARDLLVYLTQIEMESQATQAELEAVVAEEILRQVPTLLPISARAAAGPVVARIMGHVSGMMFGEADE